MTPKARKDMRITGNCSSVHRFVSRCATPPFNVTTTAGSNRGERRRRAEGGTPFDEIDLYRILVEMKHFGKAVPLVAGLGWRLRARDLAARDRFRAARRAFEKAGGLIASTRSALNAAWTDVEHAELLLRIGGSEAAAAKFLRDGEAVFRRLRVRASRCRIQAPRAGVSTVAAGRGAAWHPCGWPTGARGAWCRDPLLAVGLQEIQAAPQLLDHAIALGKLGVSDAERGVLVARSAAIRGQDRGEVLHGACARWGQPLFVSIAHLRAPGKPGGAPEPTTDGPRRIAQPQSRDPLLPVGFQEVQAAL
ncbi:MAG: hypothetical protein HYV63_16820 [Candidatus Schekmanbacteria bacterium]|nr:hypothetical protein [Candidatus Schekmanbacteria bacterium]